MILMTAATLAVIPACNARVPVLIEGGNQDLNEEVENLLNGKEHFEEIENETVHHDSQMGMSDEDGEMHPKVGAPDRLCTSANISGKDCFVGRNLKDKSIRFTSDTYYASEYNLIFNQTRLRCVTANYQPCMIHIELKGDKDQFLELMADSQIQGQEIIIEAKGQRVKIGGGSSLWASGQSLNTNGTMTNGAGASFVGQAGSCASVPYFRVYGEFDMLPHPSLY